MGGLYRMCQGCGQARLRASNPGNLCGSCVHAQPSNTDAPVLPVEFWFRPHITAACSNWDVGSLLRHILDETGITEQRLGELIDRSQAQVWRLANHKSECHDIRVIKAISDVFGCPALLLGLAPLGAELEASLSTVDAPADKGDPTDRREFIIWSSTGLMSLSAGGHTPASPDASWLHRVVRDLYDQDDQRGGGVVADVAHRYFRRVVHALGSGQYRDPGIRRTLEAVAPELGESAGWFAFDSERHALARACYTEALCIADLTGDEPQAVHILASMSLQSTYCGHPHEGVQLAQHALRRALPWATPRVLSMLSVREARAWAARGDESEFRKATIRAKQYFDQGPREDDPPWLWYFDYAQLLGDEAFGWADLERFQRAEDYIRLELGQRDAHYGRERALSYARLAEVTLAQNQIGKAGQIAASSLLPSLHDVTSARVLNKAATLRRHLAPHRSRHPAINDFVHAFDQLTTS